MQRLPIRLIVLAGFTVFVCLACVVVSGVFVVGRAPNSQLNPLQAAALHVTLLTHNKALETAAGSDSTPVKFVVNKDDLAHDIGVNLVAQGLINDADLFRSYVRYYGIDAHLQAGTYLLNQTQTIPQIAQALTNSGTSNTSVQVIEGWRLEQIAAAIDANKSLAFSGADFLAVAGKGAALPALAQTFGIPPGASLEGFLFPDTYRLPLDATAADLRDQMLTEFDQKFTAQMRSDASKAGLSIYQAVTLASIIEREAQVADERPLIASVYLNRLQKPMALDADPTIQYALGQSRTPGNWWPSLTVDDYQGVQSPYNTYLNSGLPPTPIANAGLSSINAAIYPRQSPYFYFRASCSQPGRHNFATTFAEQQANAC